MVAIGAPDNVFGRSEHASNVINGDAKLQKHGSARVPQDMGGDLCPSPASSRAVRHARLSCDLIGRPAYSMTYRPVGLRQRRRCGSRRGGIGTGARRSPVDYACGYVDPAASDVWHPLQMQDRIVPGTGVESD
jgi:hypothetical protein